MSHAPQDLGKQLRSGLGLGLQLGASIISMLSVSMQNVMADSRDDLSPDMRCGTARSHLPRGSTYRSRSRSSTGRNYREADRRAQGGFKPPHSFDIAKGDSNVECSDLRRAALGWVPRRGRCDDRGTVAIAIHLLHDIKAPLAERKGDVIVVGVLRILPSTRLLGL